MISIANDFSLITIVALRARVRADVRMSGSGRPSAAAWISRGSGDAC